MKKVGTVCFIVENGKVLLAHIEYPDGKLLWNGIGGVVEAGERPEQAVVREVAEETKLSLDERDVQDVLTINLPELDLHACISNRWQGELEIIDPTLKELRWFEISEVPYAEMHKGNDTWLPRILASLSKPTHDMIHVDDLLTLKQLKLEDAERIFSLTDKDRAYLSEYLPWPQYTNTVEDSLAFIKLMLQRRNDNQEYGYGIVYDGQVVGHISLMHVNDEKCPEIGYWIASEYSGKGIMTKATVALTDFARTNLHIPRIIIRAVPGNVASNKVAEKAGYAFIGQEDEDGKTLNVWTFRG